MAWIIGIKTILHNLKKQKKNTLKKNFVLGNFKVVNKY